MHSQWLKPIAAAAAAMVTVLCGCAEDPVSPVVPSGSALEIETPDAARSSCEPIAFTYEDPHTIDEAWSGGIKDFSIIRQDGRYHIFHITDPATSWGSRDGELELGHASSANLADWITHARIDLRTDADGWSPSFVWAPHVVHNERDGLYYMFYTGVDYPEDAGLSQAVQRVGLARSSDLYRWTRYDQKGQDGLILSGPDHEDHPWSAYGIDDVELPWEHDCRDPFVFDRGRVGKRRYVMLNTVRLAPDATRMAIAYATSNDLIHWRWESYFPVTVGHKAESANIVERNGAHYLFWTDMDDAPGVRVARSESGVFGPYELVDSGRPIFGLANETLVEPDRTLYLAFDDAFVLHVKRDLRLPAAGVRGGGIDVLEFMQCNENPYPIRAIE